MEPEHEKLLETRAAMWVAEYEQRPFAFLQDYAVADWPPHHFDYLPQGSRGIDLYIGERAMLGLGHGAALVWQHVESLRSHGAPAIGVDPHPDNKAAQRAFIKAGFELASGPVETRWGRAVLMHRIF